jgi:selenocysteine-specific elongation factor
MIVASAGHVDHGKTSLVRALTGVDTDSLPEEKRRGLTIEPGFAYMRGPQGEVLGFVDVPGHERFVANMLAGVAAIDYVLLVVAADDGVMPQTIEHVAILDLLGVRAGAVAITKADRVDAARMKEVASQVTVLLDGTSLADIPMHEVSVVSGAGIDALRLHLLAEAGRHRRAGAGGRFRLSIDRSFSLIGAGLVVTGAVVSGSVEIGEYLLLSPAGQRVRVRDIRVHGQPATRATSGDRAAFNLTGDRLTREQAPRGAWVLDTALHAPTRNLDARFRLLRSAPKPVKHWLPVHVHIAAGHVTGHLALLGVDPIAPGESGFVELILDQPVGALSGDRFIVRDQSARHTLGGGFVVNPFAPPRGRTRPQRRATAEALAIADPARALAALLEISGYEVDFEHFAIGRDLRPEEAERIFSAANLRFFQASGTRFGVPVARWSALQGEVREALVEFHRKLPDHLGCKEGTLATLVRSRPSAPLFRAVMSELIAQRQVARTGPWLHLPAHQPVPGPADLASWRQLEHLIEHDGLRAPSLSALAQALRQDTAEVLKTLHRLETLGFVIAVAKNRFFTLRQAAKLAGIAERLAASDGDDGTALTAAAFRKESGIGRNLTIEVLEYFDRAGFTRRKGAYRRILRSSSELFGNAGA